MAESTLSEEMVPYSTLIAGLQHRAEGSITTLITDNTTCDEDVASQLGRDILYTVLRLFRSDMFADHQDNSREMIDDLRLDVADAEFVKFDFGGQRVEASDPWQTGDEREWTKAVFWEKEDGGDSEKVTLVIRWSSPTELDFDEVYVSGRNW